VTEAAEVHTVEIRAPAEQTEGTRSQVLRWLKSVGETVTLNEPLIELETDKVTVEVAAPGSGTLREILKHEQDEVDPGELLGRIAANASRASIPREEAAQRAGVGEAPATQRSAAAQEPAAAQQPTAAQRSAAADEGDTAIRSSAHLLSPAVRRLLAEHGLAASSIRGSGQGGRITVQDVLHAVDAVAAKGRPTDGSPDGPVNPASGATAPGATEPVRRVPHSPVRKRIAEHMVRSLLQTAPHVTTVFEADMSAVLRHRARYRDSYASQGAPLTLTAYFLQACVAAIREVPEVNSRWTDAALDIFDSIHIGVATALEGELVVPVLRDVDSLDLLQTARHLNDLITRARTHRLTQQDVRGGTFTVSNHGVSGSLLATPIVIPQPQSAILGIGKLEKRVIVEEHPDREDTFVVQPRCYVTLTIDHRVLDGHRANRFLQTYVERLAGWPD
jgi:2-oxoglutarate dehydrogenase E2 component (dihydrolipoamide succinyltransferase)